MGARGTASERCTKETGTGIRVRAAPMRAWCLGRVVAGAAAVAVCAENERREGSNTGARGGIARGHALSATVKRFCELREPVCVRVYV